MPVIRPKKYPAQPNKLLYTRVIQSRGAIGGIVMDTTEGSAAASSPLFAMSGKIFPFDKVSVCLFVFLFVCTKGSR
jgi:hypothetical protein